MNGLIDLDACVKNLKQMLAQIAQQGQEKYPQDEEPNEYRYIHFPWLDKVAEGLTAGARKHPGETWRKIPAKEHAARALRHLSLYLAGDTSEPHLVNASMRCMMAFAVEEAGHENYVE